MKTYFIKTVIVFLLYFFQIHSVFACQYNVRETGFVDLGSESYFIYLYIDQSTPVNIINSFKRIIPNLLEESNVKAEIVNVDSDDNQALLKYLGEKQIDRLPAVILLSPNGLSLALPMDFYGQLLEQSLKRIIREILFSPVREQLLENVINTYGVVLLFECENEEDNKQANNSVEKAINNIRTKMDLMPKPIKNPPVLITLSHQLFSKEKILLWSLGLNSEKMEEPVAAVIYGRARWIGPLFIGKKITSENLTAILLTIGMDCECGLDKSWIQGTMLPVRWDQKRQRQVAKKLGFDPENPMIKMEMSRILRTGSSYPGVPMNIVNEYLKPDSLKQDIVIDTLSGQKISENSLPINSNDQQLYSFLTRPLFFVFGLSILTVAVGFFIFVKKKKRNKS